MTNEQLFLILNMLHLRIEMAHDQVKNHLKGLSVTDKEHVMSDLPEHTVAFIISPLVNELVKMREQINRLLPIYSVSVEEKSFSVEDIAALKGQWASVIQPVDLDQGEALKDRKGFDAPLAAMTVAQASEIFEQSCINALLRAAPWQEIKNEDPMYPPKSWYGDSMNPTVYHRTKADRKITGFSPDDEKNYLNGMINKKELLRCYGINWILDPACILRLFAFAKNQD